MNNKIIPYGRQNITEEDINQVIDALKSDYLTQGPKIKEFEEKFARYIGCKFAIAVSNGTAALHLCTLALEVNNGDKVITTPITFVASANCVRYCGGEVIFSDINPETYLLDIDKVKKLLEDAPKGTYKGIIVVDFAGRAANLEDFRKLANDYSLWLIEDACHAPGGFFKDSNGNIQNCGNSVFADLAIFSFHPVKHIACGEGGMITTNDENLYKRILALRTHGITREVNEFINSPQFASSNVNESANYPSWYMEMQTLGFNYRLTDFQAALGISQLDRADDGIIRRRQIATIYSESLKNKSFIAGQSGYIEGHAYHLYVIEVEDRLGLYNYLREFNILAQIHYIPCHLMPYYKSLGWKENDMPNAENYYRNCISLPMYPTLSDDEVYFIIEKILNYFK